MARGASSTGKGVRRAAPDRQARVGVREWVWWGSARASGLGPLTRVLRAGRRRDSGRSHTRPFLVFEHVYTRTSTRSTRLAISRKQQAQSR